MHVRYAGTDYAPCLCAESRQERQDYGHEHGHLVVKLKVADHGQDDNEDQDLHQPAAHHHDDGIGRRSLGCSEHRHHSQQYETAADAGANYDAPNAG